VDRYCSWVVSFLGRPAHHIVDAWRVAKTDTEIAALYDRYAADVFRFALLLAGERSDAEDITSETFVRVWTSPEPIRTETVKGYLFTIARNVHRQRLRKHAREQPLDTHDPRSPAPDPAAQAEHRAEAEAVMRELASLNETDRSALTMHVFDGLPYVEIARVLNLSLATVKIRIYRARLALARAREGK
jgi:RNA polymerase sigma-70 factor (ECF subfamily)